MKKHISLTKKLTAFLTVLTMFAPIAALAADAKTKAKPLTEDQKISHVLNRLGFGARPGDTEKVKKIGLQKYIEQQLNATTTDSPEVAVRMKNLEVLDMQTAEIFARYPNGNALLRQLEGRGRMNPAARQTENAATMDAEPNENDRRERQQKIRAYQEKYELRPPAQITQQMQQARIIRAVYSENQLHEAMTDFWLNHFNVYAGKAAVRWLLPSYERDVIRKTRSAISRNWLRERRSIRRCCFISTIFNRLRRTLRPQITVKTSESSALSETDACRRVCAKISRNEV
jgi:uncharacterized protein (DUF1800 family)